MVVAIRNERIRKILARKNMSQNCFGMRIGVSSSYMSQLMSGIRNPSPELRKKIMNNLSEYSFDDLFEIKN